MNKKEYEEYLKSINAVSSAICDKDYPDLIECLREEYGHRCPKCGYLYKYEKVSTHLQLKNT